MQPKTISDLIWWFFSGLLILLGAVSIPLIKNWIVAIIDKKLENVNKEIELLKDHNARFREEFLKSMFEIKADIQSVNSKIESEFLKLSNKLEKEFVQKKDCSDFTGE